MKFPITARALACAISAAFGLAGALPALAQTYPAKPVTIVVPFPAGGVVDLGARVFAQDWTKRLGQQFIVEPRPGGSYMVGMRLVKNAAPDGHTLMMHSNGINMVQSTLKNPGLDVRTDFAVITPAVSASQGVWIHTSVPATNMKEFVEYVRKNPGKLNYGTTGVGGAIHLPTARMLSLTGLQMVHVPYGGGPPVMGALAAGDIHLLLWEVPSIARQNKGQLRLLAMIGNERSKLSPEVPTLREAGIDMAAPFWLGFFATGGTPQPVLAQLNAAVRDALQSPDVSKYVAAQGWSSAWMPLDAARKLIAAEVEQWAQTVKSASIPLAD
jgi:tripartite-type tricarboxylate transporter receptor subunit TctC